MRRFVRVLSSSLMLFTAVSASPDRANADGIRSYDQPQAIQGWSDHSATDYPRIDNQGNVSINYPGQTGDYQLTQIVDPTQYGHILGYSLHLAGDATNLLPASLSNGGVSFAEVNASGHVLGNLLGDKSGAFDFSPETGQVTWLKSLPGATGPLGVYAMNARDEIVGIQDDKAVYFASPTSEPVELSQMLANQSGWNLYIASGINDSGEIVGFGTDPSGKYQVFRLEPSPVPEPTVSAILSLAGVALAVRSLARRCRMPHKAASEI